MEGPQGWSTPNSWEKGEVEEEGEEKASLRKVMEKEAMSRAKDVKEFYNAFKERGRTIFPLIRLPRKDIDREEVDNQ